MAKPAVTKKPLPAKKPARKAAAPAQQTVFTVGLNELRYGHDKGAPVTGLNSRVTDRKGALQELVASIRAVGLIAPLAVAQGAGGAWYVIDGNRRLAALRQVAKADKWPDDRPVEVRKVEDSLFEASLAANVVRAPMHPVDQFEAFARVHSEGMTVGDIAARFGLTDRTVRQRLALGQLHPTIRAAWRAEEIDAEAAQAFTLTTDQERQGKVFADATSAGRLDVYWIKNALVGGMTADNRNLRFVGLDVYRAAGGEAVTDLFEDQVHILNPEILDRLVREKMAVACDELIAAGWAWAKASADVDRTKLHWVYRDHGIGLTAEERQQLEALQILRDCGSQEGERDRRRLWALGRARSFTDEERAVLGCVIDVGSDGALEIEYGLSDGKRARIAAEAEADGPVAAPDKPERMVPADLAQSLSEQLTRAAAATLAADTHLALAVAVAALTQRYKGPARMTAYGIGGADYTDKYDTFAEAFAKVEDADVESLTVRLAAIVAGSLDLTVVGIARDMVKPRDARVLLGALDQERLQKETLGAFDIAAYFAKASAKAAIAALVDIDGRNSCLSKKKADIAALAAIKAKEAGWLPPELRGPGYSGPGGSAAAPAAQAAE